MSEVLSMEFRATIIENLLYHNDALQSFIYQIELAVKISGLEYNETHSEYYDNAIQSLKNAITELENCEYWINKKQASKIF